MVSADGWAWDVTRVIPVCALTGQAAGTAAALMAREDVAAARLSMDELQAALQAQGVRLHHDPVKARLSCASVHKGKTGRCLTERNLLL